MQTTQKKTNTMRLKLSNTNETKPFKKDLTVQGIEPNPGPPTLVHDAIRCVVGEGATVVPLDPWPIVSGASALDLSITAVSTATTWSPGGWVELNISNLGSTFKAMFSITQFTDTVYNARAYLLEAVNAPVVTCLPKDGISADNSAVLTVNWSLIDLSTLNSLNVVTVDPNSLPLWVTEYPTNSVTAPTAVDATDGGYVSMNRSATSYMNVRLGTTYTDQAPKVLQTRPTTAVNQVCLTVERATPKLVYKDRRQPGDSDHTPIWNATLGHENTGYVTFGTGPSKREAREQAAVKMLRKLRRNKAYKSAVNEVGWIRDLTMEGVEPNPGPTDHIDARMAIFPEAAEPDNNTKAEKSFTPLELFCPEDVSDVDFSSLAVMYPSEREAQEMAQRDHAMQVLAMEFGESVQKLAKQQNATGHYFSTLCHHYNIEVTNLFDPLILDVVPEDDAECDKIGAKPKRAPRVVQQMRTELPPRRVPAPRTTEEKKSNMVAVLARLTAGFKKHPSAVCHWLERQSPKRAFVRQLAAHMLGPHWQEESGWSEVHLLFYCYEMAIPKPVIVAKLAEFHTGYDTKYFELFTNMEADLVAAKLHNKLMHAYNGNPLSRDMADVDKAPKWLQMLQDSSDSILPLMTGTELQARVTNVVGDANPNQTRIFDQDKLRGNLVQDTNAVVLNAAVPYPSTSIIPRQMFSDRGDGTSSSVLADATTPMRVSEVNVAEYYMNPIKPTNLSEILSDAVKNNATSNWRRDNSTLAGFSSFDVASINTTLTPKGLSLESMLLKIDFMHSIAAMTADPSAIPASSRVLFDPWAVADYSQMTLGLNNSPIFNESCGGDNPVFPWGGEKGSVAFHLTLQSVPLARRADAILCPPGLLQSSEDAQAAIALFALSMAEWPFCLFTLQNNLRTENDDTVKPVTCIPQHTVTRVPGSTTLDIVLPRRWGESNPTSEASAKAQSVVIPEFGPTATAGHAAGSLIKVNYVGGEYFAVPLADYLYSWALSLDTVTIKQYLGRLGAIIGVKDSLNAVHDMNMALTQVVPKMTISEGLPIDVYRGPLEDENTVSPDDFTTAVALDYCYTSHMEVTLASVSSGNSWPIAGQVSADYRIFQTNPTVWNKVILGLATADNIVSERLTDLPIWCGNPNCFFWEVLVAIPHAIAWAMHYYTTGMSALAWATGYTSSQSQWIQEVVRATYCTTQSTGTIIPARFGKLLHAFYRGMFDRSVAVVSSSVRGRVVPMTVFDRWLPGNNYATVFGPTGAIFSGLCPVLLPDIWIQYMSTTTPKFAMSFPRPFSVDSTQGYGRDANLDVHRTNDNNQVSPYLKYPLKAIYPVREGPLITDEEMFNSRIWFTSPTRQLATMTGQPLANTTVPLPGFYPAGRNITLREGEIYPPQLGNVSTLCIPYINQDALRVVLFLSQAQASINVQVCNRARRAERSAWLLGDVYVAPSLQYITNFEDPRFGMTEYESDFHAEASGEVVLAPAREVALQAVDPAELPSAATPLTSMAQPAPAVTSMPS